MMASVEFHNLWSFDNQRQIGSPLSKCNICQEDLLYGDTIICPKCKLNVDFNCSSSSMLVKDHICCKSEKDSLSYCFNCATDLCDICLMEHQYMKHFENHNVLNLGKENASDTSSVSADALVCCLHKSEILRYYCKTCRTLICEQCAATDHPKEQHDYDYVEQDLKLKLKQEFTKKTEAKVNQLKVMEKLVENQCTQIQEQYNKIQADIKAAYCFFYSVIEDRKDQLLKELEHLYTKKMLPLTLVGNQISEALQIMEMPSAVDVDHSLMLSDVPKVNSILEKLQANDVSELVKNITTQSMDLEFSSNYQAIKTGVHDMFGFIHSKTHGSPGKYFAASKELVGSNFCGLKLEYNVKPEIGEMNSFGLNFDVKGCKKIAGRSDLNLSGVTSFNTPVMPAIDSLTSDLKSVFSLDTINKSCIKREKMIYYSKIGEFGTAEGQFAEPSGVAVNSRNEILVADTNNHRIQVFDENGKFRFKFGDVGRADGQFFFPNRVAVAPKSGDIIITERNPTHQVQIYNQYGQFVRKFGADVLQHPRGITVDHEDRIIIVECKVMKVVIFNMFGKVVKKFGCSKYVEFPNGVAVNEKEEIFISDNRAHCVKVFNYEGVYLRQIGGEGLTNYPISVCINKRGEILIADNHSSFNITVFTQDGQLIKGLESKAKHVQCFDTAILDQGSIVLASKDFRLYLYRYNV